MKLLAFLFSVQLWAAPIVIDVGTATDGCTGGTAYTIFLLPGATGDLTMRFGTFTCKAAVPAGLYTVILNFRESGTVAEAGKRRFSVKLNDQPVLSNFDLFATEGLKPIQRGYLAFSDGASIRLDFSYTLRSAIVSSIEILPFVMAGAGTGPGNLVIVDSAQVLNIVDPPSKPGGCSNSGAIAIAPGFVFHCVANLPLSPTPDPWGHWERAELKATW